MARPEIRFRPEIASDLERGFNWYESKQPGPGSDFVSESWSAIGRIEDGPEHYAIAPMVFGPVDYAVFRTLSVRCPLPN